MNPREKNHPDTLERLRHIQKIARIGDWEQDFYNDRVYWSEEFYDLIGYTPEEVTPGFLWFLSIVHPDDREQVDLESRRTLEKKDSFSIRFRFYRGDGQLREARAFGETVYETGKRHIMFGFLQDITEEVRTEEELRRLWNIIEYTPVSIVITDMNGDIEYSNPFFTRTTGYTRHEAQGKNPRILKSGQQDESFYREMWQTITRGQTWTGEFHNRRKDGSLYWEFARITPFRDSSGTITHYIAVKEDITEDKKNREQMQSLLDEFETIFSNSAVGIVMVNRERIIRRVNHRFTEITGYASEEITGKSVRNLYRSDKEFEAFGQMHYGRMTDGEIISTEHPLVHRDGREIWMRLYGRNVVPGDPDSDAIWVLDDITERKQLEEFQKSVEHIMHHDLKAPLNTLLGYPQIMLEDPELKQEHREFLQQMYSTAHTMLNQINLSLDMYRIESGHYTFQPEPVNLVDTAIRVRDEMTMTARYREVNIDIDLPEEDVWVQGNPTMLGTALINLVKNAIEASPTSGTVIVGAGSDPIPTIWTHNEGVIPEEIREHFFDKYTTASKINGTGLGTYSAKIMVEIMGADIDYTTDKKEGTKVIISFPG